MSTLPSMTSVKSSHIAAVGQGGDDLFVRFNDGKHYRYEGAGHLAKDALEASSIGKWFHAAVKGRYPAAQVDGVS